MILKASLLIFPPVNTPVAARQVARQGYWAALFLAGITATACGAVVIGTALTKVSDPLSPQWSAFLLGWLLLVVSASVLVMALFQAIATGIHRLSRWAALTGLGVCLAVMTALAQGSSPAMLGITIPVAIAFINGVRGTFAYHHLWQSQR